MKIKTLLGFLLFAISTHTAIAQDDLLNELADPTMVCIASNITLPDASIKTMSVKNWRDEAYDLAKIPTMFLIGTSQV